MRELTVSEMGFVSGCGEKGEGKKEGEKGGDKGGEKGGDKGKDLPESGTLTRPTRGESDWGERFNDAAGAINSLGSWLGLKIYDVTHHN